MNRPAAQTMPSFSLRWNLSRFRFADSKNSALVPGKGSAKPQSQLGREKEPGKNAYPFREPGRIRPAGRGDTEERELPSTSFP